MKQKIFTLLLALTASAGITFAETYSGWCGENLTWTLTTEDGVLTISGEGEMAYYGSSYDYEYPWDSYKSLIKTVIIGNGVTGIASRAFSGYSNLTSITIPNNVTSIGYYAFQNCSNLTFATISNNLVGIGDYAFAGCNRLNFDINLSSVTRIGNYAFYNCSGLTSVVSLNSVTYIGEYAFYNCSRMTSDINLNNVTSIKQYAFYNCKGLKKVVIGDDVKNIEKYAFYGCTYLDEITIGSGINAGYGIGIEEKAFYGCWYLLSVTCKAEYPPSINENVFWECGVLSGIDLYVPEESVKRYKKADVWSEFNIVGKDLGTDDPTNPTTDQFTITWQDENGNILKTDQVENGTTPAYTGTTPTKEGYDFVGWLPNIKPATKNICYTTYFIPQAQAEEKVYTVNINGENCSLNINNQYPEGAVITIEAVADECFEFQQWSDGETANPRTVTVTKDMNLTAEFNKLRYTVTGQTEAGTGGKVQIIKK
ncbi:MAG: leucine-rich repeat protein [Paludibacteraceae bacterium]|nr:leucine-rich repeat protein [Paludibacteraceae bacterium]